MHHINKIIINREAFLFLFTNSPKINCREFHSTPGVAGLDRASERLVINYITLAACNGNGTHSIGDCILYDTRLTPKTKQNNIGRKKRPKPKGATTIEKEGQKENHAELNS